MFICSDVHRYYIFSALTNPDCSREKTPAKYWSNRGGRRKVKIISADKSAGKSKSKDKDRGVNPQQQHQETRSGMS